MGRRALVLAAGLLALPALHVWGQTEVACTITEVEVEQLSNAVEVTLKADGLLTVNVDVFEFVEMTEEGHWERLARRDVPLSIPNARSQVGTFVDIGTYPVNYLELTTPPQSLEGVGLDVRLVLYEPALLHYVDVDNWDDFDWSVRWGTVAWDIRKSSSGRELSILVWSDRRQEVGEPRTPRRDRDLPSELSVTRDGELLAVDCVNVPLEELAGEVAALAGATVFVDDRVRRLATVQMRGVTVEQFMRALAAGYGLSASRENGAWYISDGLPSSLAPYQAGEARVYRLDHLDALAAIDLLPNFLVRYLRANASGDAVIAHGPRQLLDRVDRDLAAIDRPHRAVRVRTAVVEATAQEQAVRAWRLIHGGDTRVAIDGTAGTISIERGEEPVDEYLAHLRALDTAGDLRLRVRPSLVVEPGAAAELFVGERQYFQHTVSGEVKLTSAEVGVRLVVRPRVVGLETIQSDVEVEVSSLQSLGAGPPVVDTRSAETTLLTRSGDTMVIGGGLVVSQVSQEKRGPRPFREVWLASDLTGTSAEDEQAREVFFLVSTEATQLREDDDRPEEERG